jgi:hypothetical protein
MAITHDVNVKARGLSRMLSQFRGKPRFEALLASYLDEFQEIEDALYEVYTKRELQNGTATGDLLAKLGKIVGQGSEGLSDDLYRLLIQARIASNRSNGRREELINVASLLVPLTSIYVKDYPPGSVYVNPRGVVELPPYLVGQSFLARATAAGVLLIFVWSSVDVLHTFTLGSVDGSVTVPVANQSFGSVDGAVTTGGKLAGAVQVQGGSV